MMANSVQLIYLPAVHSGPSHVYMKLFAHAGWMEARPLCCCQRWWWKYLCKRNPGKTIQSTVYTIASYLMQLDTKLHSVFWRPYTNNEIQTCNNNWQMDEWFQCINGGIHVSGSVRDVELEACAGLKEKSLVWMWRNMERIFLCCFKDLNTLVEGCSYAATFTYLLPHWWSHIFLYKIWKSSLIELLHWDCRACTTLRLVHLSPLAHSKTSTGPLTN